MNTSQKSCWLKPLDATPGRRVEKDDAMETAQAWADELGVAIAVFDPSSFLKLPQLVQPTDA